MTKPTSKTISRQAIKKPLLSLFLENDLTKIQAYCASLSTENWANPLFSLPYSQDPRIKWPAVSCLGEGISPLAQTDMESARILVCRFI